MKPSFLFLLAFLGGFFFAPNCFLWIGIALFFSLVLRLKFSLCSLLMLFFGIGGLVATKAQQETLDPSKIWRGELVKVIGTVESPSLPIKYLSTWKPDTFLERSSCQFRIHTFYWEEKKIPVEQTVFLQVDDFCFFWRGQTLEVIGQLYLIRNQLHLKIRQKEGLLFKEEPHFFVQNMLRYQKALLFFLETHFSEEQNALFRMLLFGERRSEPFLLHFYRAGIAHFLAISGLHLLCFFSFLAYFFNHIQLYHKPIKMGIGLLFLGGLFLLVQFTPSMARTSGVFLLYFLGAMFKRSIDPISVSIFLLFLFISVEPPLLQQPGFQLTFAAFAGIFILYSPLDTIFFGDRQENVVLPWWKKGILLYAKSVLFSFALQIATFPILGYHFQQYHLFSSFFTPILLIPFQILLFSLFGLALGGFLLPEVLVVFYSKGLALFCELFFQIVFVFSSLPENQQSLWECPLWVYFFYSVPLYFLVQKQIKKLVFSTLVFFCLFYTCMIPPPIITFVDVGQGNATLLQKDGKVLLYDAGSLNPTVLKKIVQLCWKQGITQIDQCIISHADSDHYNLLQPLSQWIFIKEVALTQKTYSDLSWYLEPMLSQGTTLRFLQKGDSFYFGPEFYYEVIHPKTSEMEMMSDNNASLVLRGKIGAKTFGLTGDIEQIQIEQIHLDTEITLFPHHGSQKNDLTCWKNIGSYVIVSCDYWFAHRYIPQYEYTYLRGHIYFREKQAMPEFQFVKEAPF